MSDVETFRFDIVVKEYLHLQKVSEEFDAKALTFKAWSVTITGTGLAAAYVEVQPTLLVIAGVAAGMFWCVDAIWKTFQWAYVDRLDVIEKAIHSVEPNGVLDLVPMQISSSWQQSYSRGLSDKSAGAIGQVRTFRRALLSVAVILPHSGVVVGSLLLGLFRPPGS